ncbi:hypothetical protein [Rhodopila sp.]|uniref:hypothetical protein n=1 Tax=Rhodopila sp. TaxID=2480087 RepID=UPI003D12099D
MTLFGISAATLLAWLLSLVFLGAGVVNAAGWAAIKDDFVRWGYPRWWNLVTGWWLRLSRCRPRALRALC